MKSLPFKQNLMTWSIIAASLIGSLGIGVASADEKTKEKNAKHDRIVHFEQGWTRDEALDFYNTSQGSQLIPYSWFLALEQSDNQSLFRDRKHIEKLGYIPQQASAGRNPDGLPIGFVKDDVAEAFLASSMSAGRLGILSNNQEYAYNEWLGLTCAACHTAEIKYNGHKLRIDGGPALSDMPAFLGGMKAAIDATIADNEKMVRFAKRVLSEGGFNDTEKEELKKQLVSFSGWLNSYITVNYQGLTTPYGYGRLDAFGAILNRVTSSLLDIPANGTPANAPVSYPFLWNTSQLDWVQWNGSANNHIGRNVGEVTGVFAHTILKTDNEKERFYSSAKIVNLDQLERLMAQLDSPKWGSPLPAIDQKKATAGAALYAKNCVACHGVRDASGHFPMTAKNAIGAQFIQIHMVGLRDIGTDPLMAMNFVNPALNVDPGQLLPYLNTDSSSKVTADTKVPRAQMLSTAVKHIIGRQLAEFNPPLDNAQLLELAGYHLPDETPPNLVAYKARPLNGIWATAPYLHNGSVANLYQMLLPDAQRDKSFYVSNAAFDTKKVGFESVKKGNYFLFETVDSKGSPIAGNSNKGHSGHRFTQNRGEDGEWRDFTDVERYQLIEYLKTL